eukprot:UN04759
MKKFSGIVGTEQYCIILLVFLIQSASTIRKLRGVKILPKSSSGPLLSFPDRSLYEWKLLFYFPSVQKTSLQSNKVSFERHGDFLHEIFQYHISNSKIYFIFSNV